jgi:hypothetical protein
MKANTAHATPALPTQTLTVNGRTYTVTVLTTRDGMAVYTLTGKRGAQFVTIRNKANPAMLSPMSFLSSTVDRVWLREAADGTLSQVS